MKVSAFKLLTSGPADVSGLERLFDEGKLDAKDVVCIIGKTEGNGGRNDFTRDLAMKAFEDLFSAKLKIPASEVTERMIFSLSGGCEGVVSPHIVVFAVSGNDSKTKLAQKRLSIATGFTREFKPEEIGRVVQVEETAKVIESLVKKLRVDSNRDVHFIQMKGAIPSYTYEQGEAARKSGKPMRSDMVYSRGASALGAAVALAEVDLKSITDDSICQDWSKYSSTSSCSAKPGLERTEIMVMANSPYWEGDLTISSGILEDMLDVKGIHKVLAGLDLRVDVQLTEKERDRIVGIFAKSEADARGTVRGRRHTMLTDDDISDTRYSRCVLSSVIASVTGETALYVSTRAEHHGPLGGGVLAIIARQ